MKQKLCCTLHISLMEIRINHMHLRYFKKDLFNLLLSLQVNIINIVLYLLHDICKNANVK